ncbi:cyclin-like protein [Microthyrium microscopicum]|uniref:RNA polymerase II holoenzyme cyclin-like subunit n=1 Tax=Microthyrium microscopicum TaxID=703497 RepID=A0A6A6TVA7_9PEZI|nr:cyclin-like protein [Microthyrium microscopicum]
MPVPATSRATHRDEASSKDPDAVLAESEKQWLYLESELERAPSICNGMPAEDEKTIRSKGVNFITQVGVMLKLPQTTIYTASVFFNRFLMRYNLVPLKDGTPKPLHHYQIAGVALFLATKVEEHSRKLKEIVIACCRVAQKNPVLIVDEQTKDYWRWKDTIVINEDVMLELLCFDLTIESPYKVLYEMIKNHGVVHNKELREAAWAYLNDSGMTQLCLLHSTKTIACAALYFGAKRTNVAFKDDEKGRPWWASYGVTGLDLRKAYNHTVAFYEKSPLKNAEQNIYPSTPDPIATTGKSPSMSPKKRPRDDEDDTRKGEPAKSSRVPAAATSTMVSRAPKRAKTEEPEEAKHNDTNGHARKEQVSAGSEDGEVED